MHHQFFQSAGISIGELRSAVPAGGEIADFGDGLIFEFPHASARVRTSEGAALIADTTMAWCRQPGVPCHRTPLGRELVSDWIWLSPGLLERSVGSALPDVTAGPICLTLPADLFLRQRGLVADLRRGARITGVEETTVALIAELFEVRREGGGRAPVSPRQRELVDDAKALLGAWRSGRPRVPDLAQRLGCSVFYLCHTFRRVEQTTLTAYFAQLRLRAAVQRLLDGRRSELSDLAFELGFSSHSHFTAVFRRAFGTTPSALAGLAGRVAC